MKCSTMYIWSDGAGNHFKNKGALVGKFQVTNQYPDIDFTYNFTETLHVMPPLHI